MSAKPIPWPWQCWPASGKRHSFIVGRHSSAIVCSLPPTRTEGEARLLAAAPELLMACELAVQLLDSDGNNSNSAIVIAARAAIAKATGAA